MPLFPSLTGMQSFMRAMNAYGPQPQPDENVTAQVGEPDLPMVRTPQSSVQDMPTELPDYARAQLPAPPEQPSALDMFRQNVLNFPESRPTTPKSALNTYRSALQVASTPTDYDKNRVFIDGNAYQKAKVYTDKATGQKQYIQPYKQPGFGEQVLKSMAGADIGSQTADILNQPGEDAMADWKAKNAAYKDLAGAESAAALAKQREAQAGYYAAKPGIEQDKLDLQRLTTNERIRVSQLAHTLTDEQLEQMRIDGKIDVATLNNIAAMKRVEAQQAGAASRNAATIQGRHEDVAAQQAGATSRNEATIAGAQTRVQTQQDAEDRRNTANNAAKLQLKKTPAGGSNATSNLPTQQIKAAQLRANQAIQDNPDWKKYLSTDENGMVHIDPPSEHWWESGPDQKTYDKIKAYLRQGTSDTGGAPAPITQPDNTQTPAKAPGSPQMPPAQVQAAPGSKSMIPMVKIGPDGQPIERLVPEDMVDTATAQGFKLKTASK